MTLANCSSHSGRDRSDTIRQHFAVDNESLLRHPTDLPAMQTHLGQPDARLDHEFEKGSKMSSFY